MGFVIIILNVLFLETCNDLSTKIYSLRNRKKKKEPMEMFFYCCESPILVIPLRVATNVIIFSTILFKRTQIKIIAQSSSSSSSSKSFSWFYCFAYKLLNVKLGSNMFWIYYLALSHKVNAKPNSNNGFYYLIYNITQRSMFQSIWIHAIKLLFKFRLTANMKIQFSQNKMKADETKIQNTQSFWFSLYFT